MTILLIPWAGYCWLLRGARDVALMSGWGLVVFSIALSPLAYFSASPLDLWPALLGAVAGPVYAINKEYGRALGLDWTERSEICIGAALGAALSLAMA